MYFIILLANSRLIASYRFGFILFYLTLLGITFFDAYFIYVGLAIPYYTNLSFPYKMLA